MCDACTRSFSRRSLLRGAAIGGVAAATGTLWIPGMSGGAAATGDSSGSSMESASMAEDGTLSSHAKLSTSSVAATRVIPPPNAKGVKAPPIVSRAQWKANEAIRLDSRAYAPIRKLIVHHTASPNKPSNPAAVVREVLAFHATGRGFSDTGYNFMIDHRGVIYEGRAARRYTPDEVITGEDTKGWGVVGAHAKGYNAGSCGVCLIGDFDTGTPTDAALNSLVLLLSWKASRHRIDANGKEDYFDIYGGHHVFANITGHRQVGQTQCPGTKLFNALPAIRDEVERSAGSWGPLVVDTPGVLRYEFGSLRAPGASSTDGATTSDPSTTTTTPPTTTNTPTTPADGSVSADVVPTDNTPRGTGATLTGIRVTSNAGTIYTAGKARKLGNPVTSGITKVVALANASTGDGYWALGETGSVAAFGGLTHYGDAAGKGSAVDIAATSTGAGYWVLMSDGGIYPFGDAKYWSSPKRAGLSGRSKRIVPRPQSDGYWVLKADGSITPFGAAPKLGAPTGSGTPIDLAVTPTGAGYWVLTDAGKVLAFGDAVDRGDLARSKVKWRKPAAHLVRTPSGTGYVIVNSEGSMLAFGDAPTYPSFGGSGLTVAGVAPAFT